MIGNIDAKVVGLLLRAKSHFSKSPPSINIFDHLVRARKVIIFMPTEIEHFGMARKYLEKLRKAKKGWQITVITRVETVSLIDEQLQVEILPYSKDDLNWLGFPKTSLKSHFDKQRYDLALDLKFALDLVGIKVVQWSRAPLRVCFDHEAKTAFYNFSIRVNPMEPLDKKYNSMMKYIALNSETAVTAHQPA